MYAAPETITYDPAAEACSVDVYYPDTEQPRDLLVFIHGGAWRTGDKSDHADIPSLLAQVLLKHSQTSTSAPIIMVPNYRLSYHPDHPERATTLHPTHILDIARFLEWAVTDWSTERLGTSSSPSSPSSPSSSSWPMIRNVYLIGHSCGAHILSHVFLCLPTPLPNTFISSHDPSTPLRVRLLEVLRKTRAAAFLDGIYDLDALIDEYPTYSFFVEAAFGKDKSRWAEACVLYEDEGKVRHLVPAVLDAARHARIVVAHATEDELLTPVQGRLWVDHLCRVGLEQNVVNDVETLVGTHDGCLHHVGLGELLYKLMTAA